MNACRSRRLMILSVCVVLVCLCMAAQFRLGVSLATGRNGFARAAMPPTPIPQLASTSSDSSGIQLVSQLQGGFSASVITGTLAYMGEGKALTILDVSTPQQPVRRASLPLQEAASDIVVVNTTLYIAGNESLYIFDVSIPDAPKPLSTITLSSTKPYLVTYLQVVDGLVYLAGDMLQIVDARNPTAPMSLGQIELRQKVSGFQVTGGRAYVVGTGLQIIDVSNPANLSLLGSVGVQFYRQVQVVNTLAYVSDSDGKLLVFDVSNPANPTLNGVYISGNILTNLAVPQSSSFGYGIAVGLSYDPTSELQVFDLADPLHPTLRGRVTLQEGAFRLQILGTQVFVSSNDRLTLISSTNPDAPSVLSSFPTLTDPSAVQVVGAKAYITTTPGDLVIVDVSDPRQPTLRGGYGLSKYASRLQIVGNLAYVADGYYGGLQIIDISDADRPRRVGSYSTLGSVIDVHVVGNLAYIADHSGGLVIVDVSDPAHPILRGHFSPQEYPFVDTVRMSGNTAYVLASADEYNKNSFMIIDVHDPTAPVLLGSYQRRFYPNNLQVEGNRIYVSDTRAISIYNANDPRTPVLQGIYKIDDRVSSIDTMQIQRGLAYVGTYDSFQIVDLTNPSGPYIRAIVPIPATPVCSQVVGDLAFVATHNGGLQILRVPESIIKAIHTFLPNIIQSAATP